MKAPDAAEISGQAERQADSKRLIQVQGSAMASRPGNVTDTYAELEYDSLASEQTALWDAESAAATRPAAAAKGVAELGADEAKRHVESHRSVLADAQRVFQQTYVQLKPFQHREPGAKKWYLARWACLLGGDVAGQVGAALSYGESAWTAVPQAVATGMAALTAGIVGAELRVLRDAERRSQEEDDLPADLESWAHLFRSPDRGRALAHVIIGVGAIAGLFIAGGILSLRMIVEGSGAGFVYGLLALGITLASAVNSYFYADEVADQIDAAAAAYSTELKRAESLATGRSVVGHATAASDVELIKAEYQARGRAAKLRLNALKWRVMGNNPEVVGHGLNDDMQTPSMHDPDSGGPS